MKAVATSGTLLSVFHRPATVSRLIIEFTHRTYWEIILEWILKLGYGVGYISLTRKSVQDKTFDLYEGIEEILERCYLLRMTSTR